jgi:hypothetical protein
VPQCRSLAVAPLNYLVSSPFTSYQEKSIPEIYNTALISKAWNCCERRKQ